MHRITLDEIADLAMELEGGDPIDWGYLTINEKDAYKLMASSAIDLLNAVEEKDDRALVAVATITKLLVENFVLNLKILNKHE